VETPAPNVTAACLPGTGGNTFVFLLGLSAPSIVAVKDSRTFTPPSFETSKESPEKALFLPKKSYF
jgi:hypothetical protein